jgi:hypothetical protein
MHFIQIRTLICPGLVIRIRLAGIEAIESVLRIKHMTDVTHLNDNVRPEGR